MSDQNSMFELPLKENEFTTSELLTYLNGCYITKLNEIPFTVGSILDWIRLGKLPEAYGGYKITAQRLSGIRILTVEGLMREDMRFVRGLAHPVATTITVMNPKRTPSRTRLYYELSRQPIPDKVLPDEWKSIGIRGNQLVSGTKRKKN